MSKHSVEWGTVSFHSAVQCCAVQCCAVLYCAALCCAAWCCAVLCCAVLCCAVLCCLACQHSKNCSCQDPVSADCGHRCSGHRIGPDCVLCTCTEADEQTQARAHEYGAHLHTAGKYGITRHLGSSHQHDCPAPAVLVCWRHRPSGAGIVLD